MPRWASSRGAAAARPARPPAAPRSRSSASSRLRDWLRVSCATARTTGPSRAAIRSRCSSVSAGEPPRRRPPPRATRSRSRAGRPGPDERLVRSSTSDSGMAAWRPMRSGSSMAAHATRHGKLPAHAGRGGRAHGVERVRPGAARADARRDRARRAQLGGAGRRRRGRGRPAGEARRRAPPSSPPSATTRSATARRRGSRSSGSRSRATSGPSPSGAASFTWTTRASARSR